MKSILCIALFIFINVIHGYNNGVGLTPHMGWNTWNYYGCNINESVVMATAKAAVELGLLEAGYHYLTIDDCWQISRNEQGVIQADNATFPSGIKALADYVHSLGLKFGLYSSAGYHTCQGRPGSLGYERIDAETYASWGVDMLRYDNCYPNTSSPQVRYKTMSDALNATGRPIYFQMCDWGVDHPAMWAPEMGNSWRTTIDITANWLSMTQNLDLNNLWASYAGPYGWNDADNLEVGNLGLSTIESQSHFAMWALIKSPLMLGMNLLNISKDILQLITSPELIAVNQDPLGVQGKLLASYPSNLTEEYSLVWSANCTANPSQQWVFYEPDNSIRTLDGRCLDIYSCIDVWLALLDVSVCGSDKQCGAQVWKYSNYTITNGWDNQCVELNSDQGPSVEMVSCVNREAPGRQWYYDATSKTFSNLAAPGMCLEVRDNSNYEIWGGPVVGGHVVALFNRSPAFAKITLYWDVLGISPQDEYTVRDIFMESNLGNFTGSFTGEVLSHGVLMLRLTPVNN